MTASEFTFLAMGLVLGVAAGAALIEVLRARPPAPREVRVTVAPDAVPRRRAATLANDAFTDSPVSLGPAHGGPADRGDLAATDGPRAGDGRTSVLAQPQVVAEPVRPAGVPATSLGRHPRRALPAQAMPVSSGVDPMLTALRASAAATADATRQPSPVASPSTPATPQAAAPHVPPVAPAPSPAVTAVMTRPAIARSQAGDGAGAGATSNAPATMPPPTEAAGGPCDEARRIADERCELATRAKAQAADADEQHRAAQRAYDDHEATMAAAFTAGDPRAVRQAKDGAQARFRAARAVAQTAEEVETAAREWLLEINRINAQTNEAGAAVTRARADVADLSARLEHTALAADRARIAAEAAEAACIEARQAVADCEERVAAGLPGPREPGRGDDRPADEPAGDTLVAALRAGATPRIVRLLRGDRMAMHEIVTALGGDDRDARRRWQIAMADLVDAILADAIAASALDFPAEHPFWGPFDPAQARDVTAALSSLGYRFDGLGGWVDGRFPSQRDLSLALGYAGFDPMRMRHWPNEAQMTTLFEDVVVAGPEHLAGVAGGLTLGELVAMLGRRADSLTEIWNSWGRVRPLLVE